jgi:hypothetical protein
VEKREPLYAIGENADWCGHYGKWYGDFSKKLKIELYNPTIPLLSVYPKDMKSVFGRIICTPMFTAALFMIAKIQK